MSKLRMKNFVVDHDTYEACFSREDHDGPHNTMNEIYDAVYDWQIINEDDTRYELWKLPILGWAVVENDEDDYAQWEVQPIIWNGFTARPFVYFVNETKNNVWIQRKSPAVYLEHSNI